MAHIGFPRVGVDFVGLHKCADTHACQYGVTYRAFTALNHFMWLLEAHKNRKGSLWGSVTCKTHSPKNKWLVWGKSAGTCCLQAPQKACFIAAEFQVTRTWQPCDWCHESPQTTVPWLRGHCIPFLKGMSICISREDKLCRVAVCHCPVCVCLAFMYVCMCTICVQKRTTDQVIRKSCPFVWFSLTLLGLKSSGGNFFFVAVHWLFNSN